MICEEDLTAAAAPILDALRKDLTAGGVKGSGQLSFSPAGSRNVQQMSLL